MSRISWAISVAMFTEVRSQLAHSQAGRRPSHLALFNNKERDAEGQGAKRVMTLCAVEFIRRFLRHVLPFQYKRVRHFGLYAGSKRRLQTVRMLVGVMVESTQDTPPKLEMGEWLTSLGLEDAMRCLACGTGTMRVGDAFAPLGFLQLWLLLWLGVPILGQEAA
ncbi:MAG: transposase [Caldilineaceae bacterium]